MSAIVLTDIDTVAQIMKMTLSNLAEPVITFDAFEMILMVTNTACYLLTYLLKCLLTYLITYLLTKVLT